MRIQLGDFNKWDVLKMIVPFLWIYFCLGLFCYYFVNNLLNNNFPPTISLYWSLLSSLPAFMTSLNLYMFNMSYLSYVGMSREAAVEISRVVRMLLVMVVLCFLTLAICTVIQQALCRYCSTDSTASIVLWFLSAFLWMLSAGWTAPSKTHLNELIAVYNQGQVAAAAASGFMSSDQLRDPSDVSRAMSMGNLGPAVVVAGKMRTFGKDGEDVNGKEYY
eukprot:GHVS01013594.1.p1 GENE.GHVS01013594.1~~GHVS01013594.1.p1  ORF type:complete len:219 (+),score=30.62 GHVS01013594.1:51-707(+)